MDHRTIAVERGCACVPQFFTFCIRAAIYEWTPSEGQDALTPTRCSGLSLMWLSRPTTSRYADSDILLRSAIDTTCVADAATVTHLSLPLSARQAINDGSSIC
jgi:hypothetical protein